MGFGSHVARSIFCPKSIECYLHLIQKCEGLSRSLYLLQELNLPHYIGYEIRKISQLKCAIWHSNDKKYAV
jgi:hypothetical protein